MTTDAATHSYIFKLSGGLSVWAQITVAYPSGAQIPAWDGSYTIAWEGSYTRTWSEAMRMAEGMRKDFCKFERKRQARLKVLDDFENNYRDAA